MDRERCGWVTEDQIYIDYHDNEWGRPVHDDRELFELLSLEGAQAGLSWLTILKRRENYRHVFDNFDPEKVAHFDSDKIHKLIQDKRIIRNRRKIESVIINAMAVLRIQREFGSFDAYIWRFVGGEPIVNDWADHSEVPASTAESEQMSKDLKKHGFKFVGPTICYAFMQAAGMVNDHTQNCFLYGRK
ncbi:DNA-3-methyladenine glycosylase I [Lentibacillus persicus]|uniref:DNA-3-methyladenine glycosylase I n=1 Tax=Lentibacillus persicus TaxID=640948 RepID=A0A1I1Y7U3_9BACI|nr:DNA-3-methyladenine glycosylase I [Lentibacillus persicus]SFE15651.1 DNA-3-methyladenine glycosylase I [Lentibacillus persicus]